MHTLTLVISVCRLGDGLCVCACVCVCVCVRQLYWRRCVGLVWDLFGLAQTLNKPHEGFLLK